MPFTFHIVPEQAAGGPLAAPAGAAAWRGLSKETKESYADAWTSEFLVDAHDSLLMRAAPEMVNIVHNGRRSIAHHKLEALYGKFVKPGAASAVTLENALALSVFDEIEDHLISKSTEKQFAEPVGKTAYLQFLDNVHLQSGAAVTLGGDSTIALLPGEGAAPAKDDTWLSDAPLGNFTAPEGDLRFWAEIVQMAGPRILAKQRHPAPSRFRRAGLALATWSFGGDATIQAAASHEDYVSLIVGKLQGHALPAEMARAVFNLNWPSCLMALAARDACAV